VFKHKIAALAAGVALFGTGAVNAQEGTSASDALKRVEPGTTVSILSVDGREVTGRITSLTPASLTIIGQGAQSMPASQVGRVTIQDSPRNGALIGAAIGGGAGIASGLLLSAICANEGGDCAGPVIGVIGLGTAAGAGIGWLADRLHQRVVYDALPDVPRQFAPELAVHLGGESRPSSRTTFVLGGAWSTTLTPHLGLAVNVTRSFAGSSTPAASDGRGVSADARLQYRFGHARVQPYAEAGFGYFQSYRAHTYTTPAFPGFPSLQIEGVSRQSGLAPVLGGGVRMRLGSRVSLVPGVSWYRHHGGRLTGVRAGVSLAYRW
jgi:hypothetical protein